MRASSVAFRSLLPYLGPQRQAALGGCVYVDIEVIRRRNLRERLNLQVVGRGRSEKREQVAAFDIDIADRSLQREGGLRGRGPGLQSIRQGGETDSQTGIHRLSHGLSVVEVHLRGFPLAHGIQQLIVAAHRFEKYIKKSSVKGEFRSD